MIDIDIVLLVLKISILVLLYLFIWRVVRAALGDVKGGVAAVAPAPDVVLPAAGRPAAVFSPERSSDAPRSTRQRAHDERREQRFRAAHPSQAGGGAELDRSRRRGVSLAGWVTVGRAPTSDIVLDETCVSGAHARLQPRGQFYFVEDLGSTNGTFVNGKRGDGGAAQVREPAAHRRDCLPLRGVSAP